MQSLILEAKRLEDLDEIAHSILKFSQRRIFHVVGEMGAGKTTLIKALCKALHVTESVSSPTFSLVNEYRSTKDETIYHFDFYRIKSFTEAFDMGAEDYFDSGQYCFIEWGERIEGHFDLDVVEVKIQVENGIRRMELSETKL